MLLDVEVGRCAAGREDVPPGFWERPGDEPILVDGVVLESAVPTRFFQSVDSCPEEWGRLVWRVQLNRVISGRLVAPVFRTFYSGVEWNLRRPDHHWFLSAWLRWEGPGPMEHLQPAAPPVRIEGETALFFIAWKAGNRLEPLYLRSRVDARPRKRIFEAVRAEREAEAHSDSAVIRLDDLEAEVSWE